MDSCVVILSGGQDSATCLVKALHEYKNINTLIFDYGQKHSREIECAKRIAKELNVPAEVIKLDNLLLSSSPLLSDNPLELYENKEQMEKVVGKRVENTFVPMRNGLFLTIAANRAAALYKNADVIIGVCEEDDANYPDCTEKFITEAQNYIDAALWPTADIMIQTPLLHVSKADAIKEMWDVPMWQEIMSITHTSYAGDYPPLSKNHSNILRAASFEEAGKPDPLIVRAWKEGLMELPKTENYKGVTNDYPKTF